MSGQFDNFCRSGVLVLVVLLLLLGVGAAFVASDDAAAAGEAAWRRLLAEPLCKLLGALRSSASAEATCHLGPLMAGEEMRRRQAPRHDRAHTQRVPQKRAKNGLGG